MCVVVFFLYCVVIVTVVVVAFVFGIVVMSVVVLVTAAHFVIFSMILLCPVWCFLWLSLWLFSHCPNHDPIFHKLIDVKVHGCLFCCLDGTIFVFVVHVATVGV